MMIPNDATHRINVNPFAVANSKKKGSKQRFCGDIFNVRGIQGKNF